VQPSASAEVILLLGMLQDQVQWGSSRTKMADVGLMELRAGFRGMVTVRGGS
jgi:hypothetical protein